MHVYAQILIFLELQKTRIFILSAAVGMTVLSELGLSEFNSDKNSVKLNSVEPLTPLKYPTGSLAFWGPQGVPRGV